MALRKGIVVDTHPDDHAVDLLMLDNGERLVGVQVSSSAASGRTGTVDLVAVPPGRNKWDISQENGQDTHALVDYVGRTPVVMGFLFPQINQMLFKDPKLKFGRHQSDVINYNDGQGNFGVLHPSGAFIQVGESPEPPAFANRNADGNLKVDRNTGRKVHVRISLAGKTAVLTMTPGGSCTLDLDENLDITVGGHANVNCNDATITAKERVLVDSPSSRFTGALDVDGLFSFNAGMKGKAGASGGAAAQIEGGVSATGQVSADGGIAAKGLVAVDGSITATGSITPNS